MTDQQILEEFVKKGKIPKELADQIDKDIKLSGKSIEESIHNRRLLSEEEVAQTKSEIFNVPFKEIDDKTIDAKLIKIIPKETSVTYKIIPIEKTEDMLVVGMLRPDDEKAQEAIKFIAKREGVGLGVYIVTYSAIRSVWRIYTPYRSEVDNAMKDIGKVDWGDEDIIGLEEGGSEEEAPIIKIVASTLKEAVEAKVSDIHIEPQREYLRIRFRVRGDLKEMVTLPSKLSHPVISRVKVLSKLRIDETRIPQDGRFRTLVFGRDIDYRVATFPTPLGEKVAIRVLDPTVGLKGLEELGLNKYNAKILEEMINRPFGMILISGPTGSGKTTTLYGAIQKLNKENVNIVTLEDPVEYFMTGINQSQVRPEIGYSFASGLRQILRQDPDIIMVGEIRDAETANLAVNAALTGHIMLSTIHTNNSVGVVPRMVDLGVPPFLLSSALNMMIAQRLVLKLCPNCKSKKQAPPEVEKLISETLEKMPEGAKEDIKDIKPPYEICESVNPNSECEECNGSGYSGQVAVFEIFKMTEELGEIINKGFTEKTLWDEARRQGLITLRQDGILKVLEGVVSIEEIMKETLN